MSISKKNIGFLSVAVSAVALTAITSHAAPEGVKDEGGYWLCGRVNISPYVNVYYEKDDNPNNARKQKKDIMEAQKTWDDSWGYTINPGVNIIIPGNQWRIAGKVYYTAHRYNSDKVDDKDDWGESFGFNGETDGGLAWSLRESIKQVDEEELFTDEVGPYNYSTRDRLEMAFGASLVKNLSEKSRLGISGNYNCTDYDSEKLYDYTRYGGALNFAHKLTEKTDWTLTGSYSIYEQDWNSDEPNVNRVGESKAHSTKVMGGIKTRTTEKLTFNAKAGVEFYEGFENKDGEAEENTTFTYSVASTWKPGERWTFGLQGLGEYEVAEDVDNDSVNAKSAAFTTTYRPFNRWQLSAGITYRREDYERRISKITTINGNPYSEDSVHGVKRSDDNLYLKGRILFAINDYASVHASISYRDVSSNVEDFGYKRTIYGIGASVRY